MSYYRCEKGHINFLAMGSNPPKVIDAMTCSECSYEQRDTNITVRRTLYLIEDKDLLQIKQELDNKTNETRKKCILKSLHWFYKLSGDSYCRNCGANLRIKTNKQKNS